MFIHSTQYQFKSITVKSNCFPHVSDVYINGLSKLEKMNIEHNSFTSRKNSYGMIISKVFQVSNCERLQWIEIGQCSFSDFAGIFKLRNLPCLQYLIIGFKDVPSNNFVYSSFVVRSNEWGLYWSVDLPSLKYIELGQYSFCYSMNTVIESSAFVECIDVNRSSFSGSYYSWSMFSLWNNLWCILFSDNAKLDWDEWFDWI